MEWLGLVALMLLLLHAAYPGRVRRLEAQVRRLQRAQQGEADMARLIQELVGRACELSVEDAYQLTGRPTLACTVLDADDEWVKVRYADRKGGRRSSCCASKRSARSRCRTRPQAAHKRPRNI